MKKVFWLLALGALASAAMAATMGRAENSHRPATKQAH